LIDLEQKETVKEKATRLAREEWNEQCKNFIMGRAKFRDSSLKSCRNRILKDLLAKEKSEPATITTTD
jgi:hypothetical protein